MQSPENQVPRGSTVEYGREPCPDRILDDIGGAFGMGAVGGSVFYSIQSMRKSPSGQKLKGCYEAVRGYGPRLGGSFAVWGGLFSTFDCTMLFLRKKEDPWNSILAGALTGGLLSLRSGLMTSVKSAAFGGAILALIEGLQIIVTKSAAPPPPRMAAMQAQMPPMAPAGIPPPPYGGGAISPGAMATAQSQPEILPPNFEGPSSSSSNESKQQGWGSWFGFGTASKPQDSSTQSPHFQPPELK